MPSGTASRLTQWGEAVYHGKAHQQGWSSNSSRRSTGLFVITLMRQSEASYKVASVSSKSTSCRLGNARASTLISGITTGGATKEHRVQKVGLPLAQKALVALTKGISSPAAAFWVSNLTLHECKHMYAGHVRLAAELYGSCSRRTCDCIVMHMT